MTDSRVQAFAAQIAAVLIERGVSRREFARLSGAHPGQVSHFLNGREGASLERAFDYAQALGLEIQLVDPQALPSISGRQIQIARQLLGWSQDELARRLDRSRGFVSQIESGRSIAPAMAQKVTATIGQRALTLARRALEDIKNGDL